ncbi:hypothetical protein BH10PLA1_BH10PLA1_10660 [soil metagenome]
MNKFKEILEKYSQWLALALGGLWLLYMVYAHIVASETSSIEVKGDPNTYGPATVDQHIKETVIYKLNEGISSPGVLPPFNVNYPQLVQSKIALDGEQPMPLPGAWWKAAQQAGDFTATAKVDSGPLATGIPQAPAAIDVQVIAGKSIVTGTGPNNAPTPQRQLWATVFATVPMAALQQEFVRTNIVNLTVLAAQNTSFLKVELVREEQNGNTWGDPVVITSVPVNLNVPAAAAPPKWPGDKVGDQLGFVRGWAASNQVAIIQPAFFNVVQGDNWHTPGEPAMQVGVIATPAAPPPPPPVVPTPRPRPGPTGNPPRPPRNNTRGPGATGPLENPANLGKVFLQVNQPDSPMMPMVPADNNGAPGNGQPAAPGEGNAAPSGPFQPSAMRDVVIWAHDLSVLSGKTYRYSIRYTLSNPLFTFPNLTSDPKFAAPFAVDSPLSAPSAPVTIPDTTSYFIAAVNPNKSEVKVDIFLWNVGGLTTNAVAVTPGEMLLDPDLKLTLVDVRQMGSNDYDVLLADENGNITIRNSKVDRNNQVYQQLLKSH